MEKHSDIKKVSIIGMGALGLLYGGFISESGSGIEVTYVMDDDRYKKYSDSVIINNGIEKTYHMESASRATEADLVIVAVKYSGLMDALVLMEPCVGENTIILSVLNGISSEKIIAARYGMNKLIYTVAQGMDAMKFGNVFQYTQMGHLHIGAVTDSQKENLERVKNFFEQLEIPYVKEADIRYRMWSKLC